MNREIKFRAWKDGMLSGFVILGTNQIAFTHLTELKTIITDAVLMQFTGLLDKNGKEIYEGDVVNIGSSDFGFIKNEKGENVEYEVKHEGCDYILYRNDLKLKWGRLSRLEELFWQCEVIGNIYENKELLNEAK